MASRHHGHGAPGWVLQQMLWSVLGMGNYVWRATRHDVLGTIQIYHAIQDLPNAVRSSVVIYMLL